MRIQCIFYTISEYQTKNAYLIKSLTSFTIIYNGTHVVSETFPNISSGLNLLHFPFGENKLIADYLNDTNSIYVKNVEGFWSQMEIRTV